MAKKNSYWNENEFVSYEEYAQYGISGNQYEKNWETSHKHGIDSNDMCPLCAKALKEGSYRTMIVKEAPNKVTCYYFNPSVEGTPVKVGNGCFRNLMKAYKAKYNK